MNTNQAKAFFLDRDGVLCRHVPYLSNKKDLVLFDQLKEAFDRIQQEGFLSIVVTNQPMAARGLCTEPELEEINATFLKLLKKQGISIEKLYFCPHEEPRDGLEGAHPLQIVCSCRKPKIGMVLQAVKDFGIDLTQSVFVGDTWRDFETAKNACIPSFIGINHPEYSVGNFKNIKNIVTYPSLFEGVAAFFSGPKHQ